MQWGRKLTIAVAAKRHLTIASDASRVTQRLHQVGVVPHAHKHGAVTAQVSSGEEWVYDYLGYLVPVWPNGVDQRPAIVGSIVRTKPHSMGNAPAGYVAQWIAVKQDAAGPGALKMLDIQPKALSPFRELQRNRYLKEAHVSPPIDMTKVKVSPKASLQPETIKSQNGRLDVTLEVRYETVQIGQDPVRLRTYNGKLVGPVLRAKAGDTLHITLDNRLPVEPAMPHVPNSHHEWNTTNLHFHGLHVAPQGPPNDPNGESDNVLLELKPKRSALGSAVRSGLLRKLR